MSSTNKHTVLFVLVSSLLHVSECSSKDYCRSNYCRNNMEHILCKFQLPEPAKRCLDFNETIRTDAAKKEILDKLNQRRNKVASGEIKSLPSSADMMKLKKLFSDNFSKEWNEELASFAQRWANQCIKYSSPDKEDSCRNLDGIPVGQNIATIYGESPGLTPTSLVDVWYMELLSINRSILSRFRESKVTGLNHYEYFSQLVWAESREVGCGGVKFKEPEGKRTVYRLVCNFAPRGNKEDLDVYSYGAPCSRCPEDTFCDPVFKALCGKRSEYSNTITGKVTEDTVKSIKTAFNEDKVRNTFVATKAIEIENPSTVTDDENFTLFDFFSHVHDFSRQLVTTASTKHDCKDNLSVDTFIDQLKKRLSSDPGFKEILFATKLPPFTGFVDSSYTDPNVVEFVSKVYSKKESPTTVKITESNVLNSTLLVDLVEAVIFRHNAGNIGFTEEDEHTILSISEVSPVKIQAELSRIHKNSDFTGHYFFPEEDDEETTSETTEVYYDTSNIPVKDVIIEIEDIKKNPTTVDFLDEFFESDPVLESTVVATQMSPDDMNLFKSGQSVMKKFLEDITDKNT